MRNDQVARTEIQDVTGARWRFDLTLVDGYGMRVLKDGQLLDSLPAQAIIRLAAVTEFAEDYAAAVLGALAGTAVCTILASL